jgi:inorganic pyrophosphatase
MRDPSEMDTKILAVPSRDPIYQGCRTLGDVPAHFLREVEHFFAIYKELEGVRSEVIGWRDRDEALAVVSGAIDLYRETFPDR